MGTSEREYNPEQPYLLPPSPRHWLPENHLAYFISDTLDQLDLSALHHRYQGNGVNAKAALGRTRASALSKREGAKRMEPADGGLEPATHGTSESVAASGTRRPKGPKSPPEETGETSQNRKAAGRTRK